MELRKKLHIGWAQVSITPQRPVEVAGQLYSRVSRYVHDPLTATALALENGEAQVVMISIDMVSPPVHVLDLVRERLALPGLDNRNLSFNVIHTHNSSMFGRDLHREEHERILGAGVCPPLNLPKDILTGEEASEFLCERLISVITSAWENRKPGGISYATDYAAVAFNRRPRFKVGDRLESKMYGVCSQPNFVSMEGVSDHTADMLYTWDQEGQLTGVAVDIPCPSQVYELHCFLSADFWGEARNCIREELGNVFVLPLCGAGGDQNPLDLVRLSKTNVQALEAWNSQAGEVFRDFDMHRECRAIGERICDAVRRGYGRAKNEIRQDPVFLHSVAELSLPIRQVTREDYQEALNKIAQLKQGYGEGHPMDNPQFVRTFEPVGVIARYELQQETRTFDFPIHLIRLDGAVIATNPFELFADYGMRIKARCKAETAFIVQLANKKGSYLPTETALRGGSYSSKPASTTCGPEGGDLLVEQTIEAIDALFA